MKRYLLIPVLSLLLLWSCAPSTPSEEPPVDAQEETERLNTFLDSIFDAAASRDPQWESRLGGRDHYDEWSDPSDEHKLDEIKMSEGELDALHSRFILENLNPQGKLSFRLFETSAQRRIAQKDYLYYNYPVEQMHGIQSGIPSFLINVHRIDSIPDADAYVTRLKGMPDLMRKVIKKLDTRADLGVIPPKFVFPMVISDCRNVLTGAPFGNSNDISPLWNDFNKKIEDANFDAGEKERLLGEGKNALLDSVGLGYLMLIERLTALEKVAGTDDGVWRFDKGADFYQYALQRTTTTDMTADEIHTLGLQEVERIHGEMKIIMAQVEFEGSLQEFFDYMRTDKQFYYNNDAEGKARYLAEATAAIDSMREVIPQFFNTKPKADLVVKAVEAYREKSAGKAFYNRPAPDGSRPGIYYANLYDMGNMPVYQMEALAFHEAIPGHHMQLAIAQELEGLPKFRKHASFTAYVEGWALYCETLAKEMGFYKDPYSDFGRLAMELWRACRLVVDTGIHSQKWSREKAIDYLMVNTPNPEGDAVKAIERYIVMPSQATAYKIGMLKIQELRAHAEKEMGDKFDIRKFHDQVITNGPVPLDILTELVEEYINS